MKYLLPLITLVLLFGCATPMPDKPKYQTSKGEQCAEDCQQDYSDCLASDDLRPDYLIVSPRKEACKKGIISCYQLCLEEEKQISPTSEQMY